MGRAADKRYSLDLFVYNEARLIDFLLDVLLTPGPVWVGLAFGVLAAYGAWMFLPESVDRASVGGWLVAAGFVGGLLWAAVSGKKK